MGRMLPWQTAKQATFCFGLQIRKDLPSLLILGPNLPKFTLPGPRCDVQPALWHISKVYQHPFKSQTPVTLALVQPPTALSSPGEWRPVESATELDWHTAHPLKGYVSGWVRRDAEEFQREVQAFIIDVPEKCFSQGEGVVRAKTWEEEG